MNKTLRDKLMSLPPAERAELAQDLWDSLAEDELPLPSDEQIAEAERRIEAYKKDPSRASPADEVMKRIRARFE
jgi:putative addiction module component (TIGR02574 family)